MLVSLLHHFLLRRINVIHFMGIMAKNVTVAIVTFQGLCPPFDPPQK
jgi:hypothetical protein